MASLSISLPAVTWVGAAGKIPASTCVGSSGIVWIITWMLLGSSGSAAACTLLGASGSGNSSATTMVGSLGKVKVTDCCDSIWFLIWIVLWWIVFVSCPFVDSISKIAAVFSNPSVASSNAWVLKSSVKFATPEFGASVISSSSSGVPPVKVPIATFIVASVKLSGKAPLPSWKVISSGKLSPKNKGFTLVLVASVVLRVKLSVATLFGFRNNFIL